MSVVETILVFVVAPGAVVGVMALLIWGPGAARPRYRPGREWPYEPVWYAPHPLAVRDDSRHEPQTAPRALSPGSAPPTAGTSGHGPTAAGGARGTW